MSHSKTVTFAELGVPGKLVRLLADDGKTEAFPIQADALPDALAGRDILGRGRTGSGKTLAFSIPLVARLSQGDSAAASAMREFRLETARRDQARQEGRKPARRLPHPRGLVLAPTRELANQIDEVLSPLAAAMGLSTVTVYGGVKQHRQVVGLNAGADIVVACPGRLEDLLRQHLLSLESVAVVVLDEADEMADMGFLPPIERLLGQIDPHAQHMLFSATLDHGIDALVKRFLAHPCEHSVDSATSPVDAMTHHVFAVNRADKHELVRALASGEGKRILFTRTKYQAKKLADNLKKNGIPAAQLHGNLNQNQRDRNLAMFASGEANVMVATDVAARGIDVSGVTLVVQVEPPEDPKAFLHRSGRTARAGHAGEVVTLMLPEQRRETMGMLRRAGIRVKPEENVRADSAVVADLLARVGKEAHEAGIQPAAVAHNHHDGGDGALQPHTERGNQHRGDGASQMRGGKRKRKSSGAEGRPIEDLERNSRKRRGGKRVHRKTIRVTEDLRGEDAKRHDRRVAARRGGQSHGGRSRQYHGSRNGRG